MAQKTAYSTAASSRSHTTNRITPQDYPCPVKPFLIYTALRMALFVATFAVISVITVLVFGGNGVTWMVSVVVAAVVSSLLSLRVLAGPRDRFAQVVEARAARAHEKFEEIRASEDAD